MSSWAEDFDERRHLVYDVLEQLRQAEWDLQVEVFLDPRFSGCCFSVNRDSDDYSVAKAGSSILRSLHDLTRLLATHQFGQRCYYSADLFPLIFLCKSSLALEKARAFVKLLERLIVSTQKLVKFGFNVVQALLLLRSCPSEQDYSRRLGARVPQDLGGRDSAHQSRLFSLQELDSGGLGSPRCPNLELAFGSISVSEPRDSATAAC